jgi:hypothetical protein
VNGEAAEWSLTDHLLAAVVDHLAAANWMFATVNRDEDADPLPHPEPVPRPGLNSAEAEPDPAPNGPDTPSATPAEIAAFFGAL